MDIIGFMVTLSCLHVLNSGEIQTSTKIPNRRRLCTDDKAQCIQPGSKEICTGRGDCICGNCHCKSRRGDLPLIYTGRWCECDDSACPSYNGQICGGDDHGKCDCGFCKCLKSFTGRNCGCTTSTDKCTDKDGMICSGRGSCECNVCKCEQGYGGPNCSECQGCDPCKENRKCVECSMDGKDQKMCSKYCSKAKVDIVDQNMLQDEPQEKSEVLCKYGDIKFILQKDRSTSINIKASRMMFSDSPGNIGTTVKPPCAVLWILLGFTFMLKSVQK